MGESEHRGVERLAAERGDLRDEVGVRRHRPTPAIGPVADDGRAQMGEVHADLVRAARPQGRLQQRERRGAREPLEDPVAREGRATRPGGAHGHPQPVAGIASDRGLDHARRVRQPAVHQREIAPLDGPGLELAGQRRVRAVVLGDDEEAGRAAIQPVDDARPPRAADPGKVRAAVREQGMHQGPRPMPRTRVHDEPHGLVHHQEVRVLVDDGERNRLGHEREGLGRRHLDDDLRARPQTVARFRVAAGHRDVPGRDQRLEPRAREIGSMCLQEAIEAGPRRPRLHDEAPARRRVVPRPGRPGLSRRQGRAAGHRPARTPARRPGATRRR